MEKIGTLVSRAIKENKWLKIDYLNVMKDLTHFWIAIKDIEAGKMLVVDAINYEYNEEIKTYRIYFSSIINATIIDSSIYFGNEELKSKLEKFPLRYEWLHYFETDLKVLEYYKRCYYEDVELEERNHSLMQGFDGRQFINHEYELNNEQIKTVVSLLKRGLQQREEERPIFERMTLNLASIVLHNQKTVPLLYKEIRYDLKNRKLLLSDEIHYNAIFKMNEFTFTARNHLSLDLVELCQIYKNNKDEALTLIQTSIRENERVDSLPWIALYKKQSTLPIEREYEEIARQYQENSLAKPLNAFFGRLSNINRRTKRDHPIFLIDPLNFDQLRAVFNAINQDITYVQGPPGTGKTLTIKNAAVTSLFNDRTMLIVSNNNEAIDNIYTLLTNFSYRGNTIPLSVIRLGNVERTRQAISKMKELYAISQQKTVFEERLPQIKDNIMRSLASANDLMERLENKINLTEKIETYKQLLKDNENTLLSVRILPELEKAQIELGNYQDITEQQVIDSVRIDKDLLEQYLYFSSVRRLKRIERTDYRELFDIIHMDEENNVQAFNDYLSKDDNLNKFLDVFPIVITTNVSAMRLGTTSVHFDLLIMDEAGQCSNATSLIPMARANRALFVGDHRQLQPVIALDASLNMELKRAYDISDTYDYMGNSILRLLRKVDQKSLFIMLRRHYRSKAKIIGFSNRKYYDGRLLYQNDQDANVLRFINVKNNRTNDIWNSSSVEAEEIITQIKALDTTNVGVITPFRNQVDVLEKYLRDADLTHVKVGTIHTFQGGEKDIIFLSPAISERTITRTYDFIKNNEELVNVAITRAKRNFTIVGDINAIRKVNGDTPSDFTDLTDYVISNGELTSAIAPNVSPIISKASGAKIIDSISEKEFLNTLTHFLSTEPDLHMRTKMKITDVVHINPTKSYFRFANSAHFDFVLFDHDDRIVMAFEINGDEHYSDSEVMLRDRMKMAIAKDHNFLIKAIPNSHVRRYDLLVDVINSLKA